MRIILVHKNSSDIIEKLWLLHFQGSQVSSFDFFTLYTESQQRTSVIQTKRAF